MDLINGTLIVQAFNFLLAYLLLRALLLKPAVAQIQHDEARRKALLFSVESLSATLIAQQKEKEASWAFCLHQFRAIVPRVAAGKFMLYQELSTAAGAQLSQPQMTPQEEARMVSEVAQELIQGMSHAGR